AARRADARRGPRRALADARGRRCARGPSPARGRLRRRQAARAAGRGDGGGARRRRPAHAPGARARQGGAPCAGRLDARPARAHRAPRADSPSEPPDGDSMSAAGVAGTEVAEGPAVADLESLRSLWPAVVDLVRAQNALLGALIEEAEPVAVQGEELTVAFAASAPF